MKVQASFECALMVVVAEKGSILSADHTARIDKVRLKRYSWPYFELEGMPEIVHRCKQGIFC
jgi:hypothetical protein